MILMVKLGVIIAVTAFVIFGLVYLCFFRPKIEIAEEINSPRIMRKYRKQFDIH